MDEKPLNENKLHIEADISELSFPPVKDAIVLGKDSPVGPVGMEKALNFLNAHNFKRIAVDDDIISDIFVRHSLLLKINEEKLQGFIFKKIKPLMNETDILKIDLRFRITLDDTL